MARIPLRVSRLAACALLAAVGVTQADESERFSVVANGETVGHVIVARTARQVDIDYAVLENGRGPKHKERLVLGADGIPAAWTIEGTSLMGAQVNERLAWHDGIESWSSQADEGEVHTAAAKLYIANDASPWALGLYASILRHQPGGTLDVLPSGRLAARSVRRLAPGAVGLKGPLEAYVLTGVELTPQFLLLDADGRLFAVLSGGSLVVREGFEPQFEALRDLEESLTAELLTAMQRQVAHSYDVPIRIRNVRIFDPDSQHAGEPGSLVFYRGMITTVETEAPGTPPPADEVVLDGQGGTLIAGLHDMHSHNSLWSGAFYLAAGVTTTRDMGNYNSFLQGLMKRLDAGELPGPHIIPSGFIEGRSPYSARTGVIPETLAEGLRDVHWYADRGYIQIKIYNSMNPEWVKPLAAEAHALGLRVVGHIPAFTTPDRMIEDGYDEVTHINQLMLGWLIKPGEDTRTPLRLTAMGRAADLDLASAPVRHTVELMKSHHTGLDTTAVILERLMLSRAGQVQEGDAPYLAHVPIGYQRYRKRSFIPFKDEADKARYEQAFAKLMETLTMLHREGIPLWPGTDDTTGFTVHRELELYARLGMTPGEVLRIATLDCDRYLKREQRYGSLERGKRADFFLVPGDPARNVSAVREIRMVVKDGVIYYPKELYQALGITPFADPPPLLATPAASRARARARAAAPAPAGRAQS
jgi:hypothetical protein